MLQYKMEQHDAFFWNFLDSTYNEYLLDNEFSVFGPLDVRVLPEKRIAFIDNLRHF